MPNCYKKNPAHCDLGVDRAEGRGGEGYFEPFVCNIRRNKFVLVQWTSVIVNSDIVKKLL